MPRGLKSSRSSAARAMVDSMGAPAGLSSFMGGFSVGTDTSAPVETESDYAVNLKLLRKESEITKQKAFDRLLKLTPDTPDEVLLPFASAAVEAIIQNAEHTNPTIRTSSFQLLHAIMSRSKDIKKAVAPELKALASVWVMGMNDIESSVSQAATAAFDAAFVAEKRTLMLQQFMDPILETLCTTVEESLFLGRILMDDTADRWGLKDYAALKSMGFMIKQVSGAQPAVLKFVQDPTTFGKLIPPRIPPKTYLLRHAPVTRSAVLGLLRDVITICPATPKIHQLVSQALVGSIIDKNIVVASRTWELLLYWCRTNVSDVVSHMKAGFLDDVVNSFMDCDQPDLADVIYPCLFPLLTSLSKDSRCEGMLDEFCAALVEKLRQVMETPNVFTRDLSVRLAALLECWELHCVRKKTSKAPSDSVELFTVICFNLVLLTESEAKAARFLATSVRLLATSLLKTGMRCEEIFQQCIQVVAADPSAAYRVLPEEPAAAELRSFHRFQGHLFGRFCAMLSNPATGAAAGPAQGEAAKNSARCKALVIGASNTWLEQQLRNVPTSSSRSSSQTARQCWVQLAFFFDETRGSAFCPSDAVADGLLTALCAHLKAPPTPTKSAAADSELATGSPESMAALATLVKAALEWKHRPAANALVEATSSIQESTLKEAALHHLLQDPARLYDAFASAVARLNAEDTERCVAQYVEQRATLSPEQHATMLKALRNGLKALLSELTEDEQGSSDESGDDEGEGDASFTSSSSSGSSSDSASSSSGGSSSSADDSDSDAASSSSSADSSHAVNRAPEVQRRLLQWMDLLRSGTDLAGLLQLTTDDVAVHLLIPLAHIVVALAPRVFPEQFISVKGMRQALKLQQQYAAAAAAGDDEDSVSDDFLTHAMEAKRHGLSTTEVAAVTEQVEHFLDGYKVTRKDKDAMAAMLLRYALDEDDDLPLSFFGVHQLSQLTPFASAAYLQSVVTAETVWQQTAMEVNTEALVANEAALSLYDGYLSLDLLRPRFTTVIRTAQLVRLMESTNGPEAAVAMASGDPKAVAHLFCELLRVAACKEALAEGVCRLLFDRILPAMFACFDVATVAVEVARRLTAETNQIGSADTSPVDFPYLLPTLAAVLRDIATAEDTVFLRRAIRLVSAVASTAVTALFTPQGAKGIQAPLALAYTTFFSVLDEAADMLRFNIAAQIPAEQERLLLEASCQLPTWDLTTAKLTLVVVRHLASLPAVADSTVRSLIDFAAKQTPLAGLELLAELACTRIPTPDVYSELIRVIIDALCRSHRLRHLPPNGRLQKETGGSLVGSAPVALTTLRRVVMAAVLARRGVVLHSRMDSVLRSTVNLVVFDAVCEAVSRLRTTKESEVAPLAKLIAFTSRFMGDLLTGDVMALRASEISVEKIASVLNFAYAWLFATSITKLELLGVSTVAGVMRSVCLLANLTLMRSSVSLHAAMQTILQRTSLKPLREDYSTAEPAKITQFRHQNTVLTKTHKQKMLLFPYLLAWCIHLTTPPPPTTDEPVQGGSGGGNSSNASRDKEWQRQVYALLDLLFTLMLTPLEKNAKRLDETFIGASMHPSATPDSSPTGQLGFEVVALTRVDAADPMAQLARGAFAVFTQLLHGSTLALTKSWLETIERKGRALFFDTVGQHISGILIQESFLSVLSHSPDGSSTFSVGDSCGVEVNVAQQLIDLTYEMEDAKVAVRITFPAAFPLRPPVVEYESGRECGVSLKKWRAWMLKMSVSLFGGSANVWECIDLFHQNLEAHFHGIEPCPICFAVVNAVNHKLPDLRCSVCHNSAFHSNCLYTWWASGFNNVCPLCRSPWIAE